MVLQNIQAVTDKECHIVIKILPYLIALKFFSSAQTAINQHKYQKKRKKR